MADYGTLEGVGVGLGNFAGSIGEGIAERGKRQDEDRDKFIAGIDKQIQAVGQNVMEKGGPNAPEAKDDYAMLHNLIDKRNAQFKPHETPLLVRSLQRMFGKTPAPPTPSPFAETAEQVLATLPVDKQSLMYNMNQAGIAYSVAHAGEKDEQGVEIPKEQLIQKGRQDYLTWYLSTGRGGGQGPVQHYQLKDGTFRNVRMGSAEEEALLQEHPDARLIVYASQAEKPELTDEQTMAEALNWRDYGIVPKGEAAQIKVGNFMRQQGWAPHSKTIREGWVKDEKGVVWNVQLDMMNHIIPGTANRFRQPPTNLRDQVRPGMFQWVDPFTGAFHHQSYETTIPAQTGNLATIADPSGQAVTLSPAAPASAIPSEPVTVPESGAPTPPAVAVPTVPSAVPAPLGATGATPPGAAPTAQTTQPPERKPTTTLGPDIISGQKETAESRSLAPRVGQAKVVLQSGTQLIQRIRQHPEYFGPVKGRETYLKVLAGGGTPEARAIYADLESFAALQGFFHGTRGIGALRYFSSVAGTLADKPENAIAATQILMEQAGNFIAAGGREPVVDMPEMIWVQAPGHAPAQIHSSQWDAFRKKAPNGVMLPGPPQQTAPQQ